MARGLGAKEIQKGLNEAAKAAKNPNKHLSENGYKSGLKKEESEGE